MKTIYYLLIATLFGMGSVNGFAQWKIDEGFESEIPSEWSGNLGNPGWSYTATVSSLSGVAKGQTGASTAAHELISPKVEISAGDSIFFNHLAIASAAENCQFLYKINNESWNVFHQTNQASWQTQSFALSEITSYQAEDSIQFKFMVHNETTIFLYVDFFKFGQTEPSSTPDCVNLNYPENNATEMGLYPYFQWTQSNLSANYKICLGTDNPPSNLLDSVSTGLDSIYSLSTQLNPNETYYWQVIAENSLGQSSACDIYSFTTQADLYPYAIDFENPDAVLPGGWTVLNDNSTTGMNEWHAGYTEAGNGNNGSNGFLSISLNFTEPKDSYFISPALPMNNDNLYKITFYYNALAQGAYERMEVKYGSESSIAGQTVQIWDNPVINRNGFVEASCYIQPETNDNYHISWHAYSHENEFALIIDDILIEEMPNGPGAYTQPNPVIFPATTIGESSNYELEIINQGSGTLESTSIAYPAEFSGPENFSITNSETITITYTPETQRAAHDTLIIETNGGTLSIPLEFTGGKKAYDCNPLLTMYNNFIVIDNNNDNLNWEMNDYRPHEGEYSFQLTDDFTSESYDDYLITEPLYVYEDDIFSFWARTLDEFTFFATWEILIATNAGTTVADFTEVLAPTYYLPGEWTAFNYDLSDYAGQIIRIAVHSNSTSYWTSNHYMDNLGLPWTTNPLECVNIISPAHEATNVNHNEAQLTWETDELANNYQLSIGTDNPPTNHFVEFVGNTGDYTFADLNPNTTYYWSITPHYGDFNAESCNIQSFTTGDFTGINQSKQEKICITKENGKFYLNNPSGCKISNVNIYNIQGISVDKKEKTTTNNRIKLEITAPGIHLIKFKCENEIRVLKVSNTD